MKLEAKTLIVFLRKHNKKETCMMVQNIGVTHSYYKKCSAPFPDKNIY